MKKALTLLFITLWGVLTTNLTAQNDFNYNLIFNNWPYGVNQYLTEDGLLFYIDSTQADNIWQAGTTTKPLFSQMFLGKGLMTDSLTGKQVKAGQFSQGYEISLAGIPEGIYILKTYTAGNTQAYVNKIIKN
ncbi:MAG: T9SS type A sorting domain-containing protein [Flavobacteriales bacterium]